MQGPVNGRPIFMKNRKGRKQAKKSAKLLRKVIKWFSRDPKTANGKQRREKRHDPRRFHFLLVTCRVLGNRSYLFALTSQKGTP